MERTGIITMRGSKSRGAFFSSLRKKLRDRRGVTLTELLCTIAIMSIVLGSITMGIVAAAKSYENAYVGIQKQQLSISIEYILGNELRYAEDIHQEGEECSFRSKNYAGNPESTQNGLLLDEGKLCYGTAERKQPLLSEKIYHEKLNLSDLSCEFNRESGCFLVQYEIQYNGKSVLQTDFSVRNLNF